MRVRSLGALLLTAGLAASLSGTPAARAVVTGADAGATPSALGVLAFGPGNVLFAADPQGAAIYAFDLGAAAGAPGAADVPIWTRSSPPSSARTPRRSRSPTSPCTRRRATSTSPRCAARAPPRRRRWSASMAAGRLDVVALGGLKYHVGGAAERAGRQPAGAPRPAGRVDHRHGVRQRPADRRRPVERGVRLEAARGEVPVLADRARHQRRGLPRQPRRRRDALAGLRLRAVHHRRSEANRRVHGEVGDRDLGGVRAEDRGELLVRIRHVGGARLAGGGAESKA